MTRRQTDRMYAVTEFGEGWQVHRMMHPREIARGWDFGQVKCCEVRLKGTYIHVNGGGVNIRVEVDNLTDARALNWWLKDRCGDMQGVTA